MKSLKLKDEEEDTITGQFNSDLSSAEFESILVKARKDEPRIYKDLLKIIGNQAF